MLLTDEEIKKLKIITPLQEKVKCGLSYGLEPNGYTISLDNIFAYPMNSDVILDPMDKNTTKEFYKTTTTDVYILLPKSFVLAKAKEKITMPNTSTAFALTKSSYARLGVIANYQNPNGVQI